MVCYVGNSSICVTIYKRSYGQWVMAIIAHKKMLYLLLFVYVSIMSMKIYDFYLRKEMILKIQKCMAPENRILMKIKMDFMVIQGIIILIINPYEFRNSNFDNENGYDCMNNYNSYGSNNKYQNDGYHSNYGYYKIDKCNVYVLVGESILVTNLLVLIIKCVYLVLLVVLKQLLVYLIIIQVNFK